MDIFKKFKDKKIDKETVIKTLKWAEKKGVKEAVNINPYLNGRRKFTDFISEMFNSFRTWQIVTFISLLIALASVGGIIFIGSQSKFIPYIVEVDKLGSTLVVNQATRGTTHDARILYASVANFITDLRTVTPDIQLQRKSILKVYAMTNTTDPIITKLNEYYQGATTNPFERAKQYTNSVQIINIVQQSRESYQADWEEMTYNFKGELVSKQRYRAVISIYIVDSTKNEIKVEQLQANPLGIYVKDIFISNQKIMDSK